LLIILGSHQDGAQACEGADRPLHVFIILLFLSFVCLAPRLIIFYGQIFHESVSCV
jgi:hypothetical protein